MTAIFHDMIHDIVEDYVDDLVVKSRHASDHVAHLKKVFDRCRKYQLKMNPKKCAFAVSMGKFLGVVVHREGITADEAKVMAIRQMPSPTSQDQLRTFAELLATFPTTGMDIDQPQLPGELPEIALIEEPEWQLMFDGAASAGGGGIGIVLVGPESQVITKTCKLLYNCSNNEAEYEALIMGLELAESENIKRLLIRGDSRLAIQQLKGEFAVKEPALAKYRTKAQHILQKFQTYKLEHVARSQNRYADALATLASKIGIQKDQQAVITVEAKGPTETEFPGSTEDGWITETKAKIK
ncbi:hypothetical protein UlMin_033320 [Ulmus minor]